MHRIIHDDAKCHGGHDGECQTDLADKNSPQTKSHGSGSEVGNEADQPPSM